MRTRVVVAAVGVLAWLLVPGQAGAEDGLRAEARVAHRAGSPVWAALFPEVRAGWRLTDEWSVGIAYGRWRVLEYDMRLDRPGWR